MMSAKKKIQDPAVEPGFLIIGPAYLLNQNSLELIVWKGCNNS